MLSEEYKRKLFLKKAYYKEHPEEAHKDRMRVMRTKTDEFIMKKIYKWLEEGEDNKMKLPIVFAFSDESKKVEMEPLVHQAIVPVKSLVQVYFPERNQTLTYFNDQFDLKRGDFVFVDGKLENIRGIVREVNKNFKIKVSDYKKVISVADTNVSGQMHMAGSHFVSFDTLVLPYEKIRTWYLPPVKPEDEFETGNDDTVIILDKLGDMKMSQAIWERGREYYIDNHVRYICVDAGHGRAIVEGERAYEVEFDFADGEIRNLICSCPCGYTCKHEVAALMQLKEILDLIEKYYADQHANYFAAITKGDLFRFAIDSKETGSFML